MGKSRGNTADDGPKIMTNQDTIEVTITLKKSPTWNVVSSTGKTLKVWSITKESAVKADEALPEGHYIFRSTQIAGGVKLDDWDEASLAGLDYSKVVAQTAKRGKISL